MMEAALNELVRPKYDEDDAEEYTAQGPTYISTFLYNTMFYLH